MSSIVREYFYTVLQINKVKNGIKLPGVLAEYDKGNYTCIVQDHLNNLSRTFVLDILSMSSLCILCVVVEII